MNTEEFGRRGSGTHYMFGSMNRNELPPEMEVIKKPTTPKGKGKKKTEYQEEYLYPRRKTQQEIEAEEEEARQREITQLKANAGIHSRAGNLENAVDIYTKILKIEPKHVEVLLLRASCYFEMKNFKATVKDSNQALSTDPNLTKAIGIKAEAQYLIGEFEAALVSFHRAKRLRPGIRSYTQGIQKCRLAIENAIGESSGVKLTLQGDLSHFDQFIEGKYRENSAYKRATRWEKDRKSPNSAQSKRQKHDPKTVKQLLHELYGDYEYLEMLLSEEEKQLQKIEKAEQEKEEEKRRKQEQRIHGTHDYVSDTEETEVKTHQNGTINEKQKQRRKNTSTGIKSAITKQLDFLHQRTEFYRQQQPSNKGDEDGDDRSESSMSVASVTHSDELIDFMEQIENDLANGKYNICLKKCNKALEFIRRQMYSDLPNRDEFEATIYSFMGNAYFEIGDYSSALEHHKRDLEIAKKLELKDAYSRALDNLGRTYSKMGKFAQAISIFEEKLGLAKEALEAAWLHHELGRCYYEEKDFIKAFEHSEHSLSAAEEANDKGWKLNATVLMAQAHEEMGNYDDALSCYNNALKIARSERDKIAQVALNNAIKEIKQKMDDENMALNQDGEDDEEEEEQYDDTADLRDQIREDNEEEEVNENSPEDIKRAIEESNAEAEREQQEAIRDAIKQSNAEQEEEEKEKMEDIRDSIKKSNKSNSPPKKTSKSVAKDIKKSNAKHESPKSKQTLKPPANNPNTKQDNGKKQQKHNTVSPAKNLEKSPYKTKPKGKSPKKAAEEPETEENKGEEEMNQAKDIRDDILASNEQNDVDSNSPADIRDAILRSNKENDEEEEKETQNEKDTEEKETEEADTHQQQENKEPENSQSTENNESQTPANDENKDTDNTPPTTTTDEEAKEGQEADSALTQEQIQSMIKSSNAEHAESEETPKKEATKDDFFD